MKEKQPDGLGGLTREEFIAYMEKPKADRDNYLRRINKTHLLTTTSKRKRKK